MGLHLRHLAFAAIAALATACGGTGSGSGTMSVHLVDGTTSGYTAVNLDVMTVSIHSGASGWITLGSPGKVVRQLSADEIIGIKGFADYYVQRFKLYRTALKAEP